MRCPLCSKPGLVVLNARAIRGRIKRQRVCKHCGARIVTMEEITGVKVADGKGTRTKPPA